MAIAAVWLQSPRTASPLARALTPKHERAYGDLCERPKITKAEPAQDRKSQPELAAVMYGKGNTDRWAGPGYV